MCGLTEVAMHTLIAPQGHLHKRTKLVHNKVTVHMRLFVREFCIRTAKKTSKTDIAHRILSVNNFV